MSLLRNILYPTDFSTQSNHAKEYAQGLAKKFGATLHVAHVIDTLGLNFYSAEAMYGQIIPIDPPLKSMREEAEITLRHVIELTELEHISATPHLKEGHPAKVLLQLADDVNADLIVIGTHGRTGFERLLFGSTCEKILRKSNVPVLTVKPKVREFIQLDMGIMVKRVLCPVDFSDCSNAALPYAIDLSREFDARLELCHVIDMGIDQSAILPAVAISNPRELLERTKSILSDLVNEYSDIDISTNVSIGVPYINIVKAAETTRSDIIIMATHGRSGVTHAVLGSTAEKIVRSAHCPVMTIRSNPH